MARTQLDEVRQLINTSRFTPAHFMLKKILRRQPDNLSAQVLSVELLLRSGQTLESTALAERLLHEAPANFNHQSLLELARSCFELELHQGSVQLYSTIKSQGPLDVLPLYHLGISQRQLGDVDAAEENLRACIRLRPAVGASYLQLGHLFKIKNDAGQAEYFYKAYISHAPGQTGSGYWSLADLKQYQFDENDRHSMLNDLKRQVNPAEVSALHFALGRASEQHQQYDQAAKHYSQGNQLQAQMKPFKQAQFEQLAGQLCEYQPPEADKAEPGTQSGPRAIFIVGLPRSGTTLIEQILSSHSKVEATDELPFIERIALQMEVKGGYVKRLATLSASDKAAYRQQYLTSVSAYLREDCDYFIDKNPNNFLHLGLIKSLLPDAIIIDSRRDIRDNAISIYRQLFSVGHEYGASFADIGHYYQAYTRVMAHWSSIFDGSIKAQQYEQLVREPHSQIAGLLDFCGLIHEQGCFEFYKNTRSISTPSVSQVTQPMYTSSIGQWKSYAVALKHELRLLHESIG